MPLLEGHSDDIVSSNIKELRNSGFKENQAVAIALKKAGKSKAAAKATDKVVAKKTGKIYAGK